MMSTNKPDFLAIASDSAATVKFTEQLEMFGVQTECTKVVDFIEDGRIAFIRYPGNSEMFHYYLTFSWQFSFATLILILLLSVIMIRNGFRLKKLIEIYLDISSLILTKSMPYSIINCDHISRLVLGPIMLLFLLASIEFCNLILDSKMMKVRDKIIDSWEDLALWKDVKIVFMQTDIMADFVRQKEENEMARNFADRQNMQDFDKWMDKEFLIDMANNISSGKAVFIKNKLLLIFLLMRMANYVKQKDPHFLDKVHLSRKGGTSLPYFIPSFLSSDHPYYKDLNKV